MKIALAVAAVSMLASPAVAQETNMKPDPMSVIPALERYTQETLIGDVWKRPGLTPRDRSLVTLAALVARYQTVEMAGTIERALDSGVKPAEISELITHLAFYAGRANALTAAAIVKNVFNARKIGPDQLPPASPKLLPLNEAAEADRAKRIGDQFGAHFPGVTQYTTDVLFRDLWLRPDLAPRDRSLVTISALVANGQVAQLTGHIPIGDEQWFDAAGDRRGHYASRLLCRLAECLLGDAGRQGRVRKAP